MEDRSSIVVAGVEVLAEVVEPKPPATAVRFTPAAQALRENDHTLEWLERKLHALKLPPDEFIVTLGVKGERSGWGVEVKPDSLALFGGEGVSTAITRVFVKVTEYQVQFIWQGNPPMMMIVGFNYDVVERMNQRDSVFVTKIRFVMTELMLGRYGLQGYR